MSCASACSCLRCPLRTHGQCLSSKKHNMKAHTGTCLLLLRLVACHVHFPAWTVSFNTTCSADTFPSGLTSWRLAPWILDSLRLPWLPVVFLMMLWPSSEASLGHSLPWILRPVHPKMNKTLRTPSPSLPSSLRLVEARMDSARQWTYSSMNFCDSNKRMLKHVWRLQTCFCNFFMLKLAKNHAAKWIYMSSCLYHICWKDPGFHKASCFECKLLATR